MFFRSQKKTQNDVSLSEALEGDGDGELSIQDVLYEEDDILERITLSEDGMRLRHYLESALNQREREILTLRYGLSGRPPLPQREVAKQLGISRSYVSRIEKRALEKLRLCMERES